MRAINMRNSGHVWSLCIEMLWNCVIGWLKAVMRKGKFTTRAQAKHGKINEKKFPLKTKNRFSGLPAWCVVTVDTETCWRVSSFLQLTWNLIPFSIDHAGSRECKSKSGKKGNVRKCDILMKLIWNVFKERFSAKTEQTMLILNYIWEYLLLIEKARRLCNGSYKQKETIKN